MNVCLVNTVEDFNKIYHILHDKSLISENPNIHHIGFDTEYINKIDYPEITSTFPGQINPTIAICQIQIFAGDFCVIISIHNMLLPPKLKDIITSTSWYKTGVDVASDLEKIMQCFGILNSITLYIDLKINAFLEKINKPNLENLVNIFIDEHYKKITTPINNWTLPLEANPQLLKYAIDDAYFSWLLGKRYINIEDFNAEKLKYPLVINYNFRKTQELEKINYISILQEFLQKKQKSIPIYLELPPENGKFCIQCIVGENTTSGQAKNKKEAKRLAAKNMINFLKKN